MENGRKTVQDIILMMVMTYFLLWIFSAFRLPRSGFKIDGYKIIHN
jgi:hypothetical protein